MEDKELIIKTLELTATDMKSDAENFDGCSFNGRTIGEYFGNQDAAIATLAKIVKLILEQPEKEIKNEHLNNSK